MPSLWAFWDRVPTDWWWDLLDILVVAYLTYRALLFFRGTRAQSLLKGLLVFLVLAGVVTLLPLRVSGLVVSRIVSLAFIAIVIIFHPELRMGLERLGRGAFLGGVYRGLEAEETAQVITEVVSAAERLSAQRTGALLALQRDTGLADITRTGTPIGARVSAELLCTIFTPPGPLHDGGVVINANVIVAASCAFPHSDNPNLPVTGMRHRAAVGLSERTDAVCLVVSEETGTLSLAVDGGLIRDLERVELTEHLLRLFETQSGLAQRLLGSS